MYAYKDMLFFPQHDGKKSSLNVYVQKSKITNHKQQITNKSQIPILNDQNSLGIDTGNMYCEKPHLSVAIST
jgi:hypothetical protein